jgi:Ca2+-binding EF-hand superfamily protein
MGDKEAQPDLRAADTDMIYTVTPQEFTIAMRHEFNRMDKDQDGRLTRAELLMGAPQRIMGREAGGQGAPP